MLLERRKGLRVRREDHIVTLTVRAHGDVDVGRVWFERITPGEDRGGVEIVAKSGGQELLESLFLNAELQGPLEGRELKVTLTSPKHVYWPERGGSLAMEVCVRIPRGAVKNFRNFSFFSDSAKPQSLGWIIEAAGVGDVDFDEVELGRVLLEGELFNTKRLIWWLPSRDKTRKIQIDLVGEPVPLVNEPTLLEVALLARGEAERYPGGYVRVEAAQALPPKELGDDNKLFHLTVRQLMNGGGRVRLALPKAPATKLSREITVSSVEALVGHIGDGLLFGDLSVTSILGSLDLSQGSPIRSADAVSLTAAKGSLKATVESAKKLVVSCRSAGQRERVDVSGTFKGEQVKIDTKGNVRCDVSAITKLEVRAGGGSINGTYYAQDVSLRTSGDVQCEASGTEHVEVTTSGRGAIRAEGFRGNSVLLATEAGSISGEVECRALRLVTASGLIDDSHMIAFEKKIL